jgi:hypothetical protein
MLSYSRRLPWQIHALALSLSLLLGLGIAAKFGLLDSGDRPDSLPLYGDSGQLLGHCEGHWVESKRIRFVVKPGLGGTALCTEGRSEITYAQPVPAWFNNDVAKGADGAYLLRVRAPPHSTHVLGIAHELHLPTE